MKENIGTDLVEQVVTAPLGHFRVDLTDVPSVKQNLLHTLTTVVGRNPVFAESRDWYAALTYLLRGFLGQRLADVGAHLHDLRTKRVYYLSVEYLPGRLLLKTLVNLGARQIVDQALRELGQSLDEIFSFESDTALGNGGLGRLAACFLDSLATHNYPGFGYGIRYEYGMFTQTIENGQQVEHPEQWLRFGDPWQFKRPTINYVVRFNGYVQRTSTTDGDVISTWIDTNDVTAMAYDLPMSGYESSTVLYLRLWAARASSGFDLRYFNEGNYIAAVDDKTNSENLSKVLYPNDATSVGQELRLKQEYFFVSASVQDILRRHLKSNSNLRNLSALVAIQLNDTHPSLALPELMRILVDEYRFAWDDAWEQAVAIFGYTNHTLLPEALETWPIAMLERILPRHLEIIYRINENHLRTVKKSFPDEADRLSQLSLVDDWGRRIRMAHLAIVGSHRVNGVSELQTRLLKETVFPGFSRMAPEKFIPITNGVTPRQWLLIANPLLAALISERIGRAWPKRLEELHKLVPIAEDADFRDAFRKVKRANKERLANLIERMTGERIDPASMFDVQVKRIHEYKRQLLNLFHVITRYRQIKAGNRDGVPRTVIIGGKAAPGYEMAKRIIRLINDVAAVINRDPDADGLLKLVFVPNYGVSMAELIIPGADVAQHISTAGTEASGTSNMKFALNGALTLGTLDGANIELRQAVGTENMFLFGLTANEVTELRAVGYQPWKYYENDADLKACIDMIEDGTFSPNDRRRYSSIRDALLSGGDHYLLLADFRSYLIAHAQIEQDFRAHDDWTRRAVLNVANVGRFSSDRAVHEYAEKIWGIRPISP